MLQHEIILRNFFITVFIIWSVKGANITIPPSSVSTSLYTLANFTCVGIGNTLSWTVGGKLLTDPFNQDMEISVTTNNMSIDVWSSVLTIRAIPVNNGMNIQCVIISSNPYRFIQKGATLKIKGVSSVQKLAFFLLGSFFSLIWSPPSFYSNDIPQGSITSYHVRVMSKNNFVIVDDNTTGTFYQLPSNLTVCDIYTASVKAFIEQYRSLVTTITKQYTGNYSTDILNHTVKFKNSGNNSIIQVQFTINIKGFPHLCNSTIYGITKDNVNNETTTYHHVYIKNVTDVNETTIYYNITGLHPSLNYTFTTYIMDLFNNIKNEYHMTFSTYHVQGLTLHYYYDNGSVLVECRFAERSTADGCHVIFRESSKGAVKSINMSKSSIEENTVYQYITLPVSGNYTVTAHDIVDGTIITNPSVVYPQVLEYILLLLSPTKTAIVTSTELSDKITILFFSIETSSLTSDITSITGIVTSVVPTSGTSTTKQPVLIITTCSVVIIIVIAIIVIVTVYLKKRCKVKGLPALTNIIPISNDIEESRPSIDTLAERDDLISIPEQKQTSFMTTKSRDKSFMTTSNIFLESQYDVKRQKHLIRKVFNKYKIHGQIHDSRLWQLAEEMAKSDLVPPELAFKSPSFEDICDNFIEKMESCSDVEYHCRMFLKICSEFSGSRIAFVGRDIQRDLRSEGVIININ